MLDVAQNSIRNSREVTSRHALADSIALLGYVVYTSCTMFNCLTIKLTDIPIVGGILAQVYLPLAASLLLTAIALRPWRWKTLGIFGAATIAVLLFFSGELSNRWDLFYFLLLLLAIGGMDYRRLIRCLMWELLITLVACFICTKILGFYEWWDYLDGGFESGRGAYHPNLYSIMVFCAVLCIAFTIDRKKHFVSLLLLVIAGTAFSYVVQSSDTSFILFVALTLALIIERAFPKVASLVCTPQFFFISLVIIVCSIVLFVLCAVALYSPDNQAVQLIDRMLHGRLRFPSDVFHEYGGYPLFGRVIEIWTGSASEARMLGIPMMMIDSTYPLYALTSGLAAVGCIVCLFCRSCFMLSKSNPSFLLWAAFVIMASYMVMEFTPAFLCLNCTLPLFAEGLRPRAGFELKPKVDSVTNKVEVRANNEGASISVIKPRGKAFAFFPMGLLIMVLAINSVCALLDGTGSPSVAESFPKSSELRSAPLGASANTALGTRSTPIFSMSINQDGIASVTYLDRTVENRVYKDYVEKGLSYFYTFTNTNAQSSSADADSSVGYNVIRIIQPTSLRCGDIPKHWAWILLDRTNETAWSYWFTLNDDGTTIHGTGPLNYEEADAVEIEQAEVAGTWSMEQESGDYVITVTDDSNQYTISFSM